MVSEFNKGYPTLFNQETEEDEEEDEESGGDKEDGESNSEFTAKWGWFALVNRVSDTTKETWNNVFHMDITSFFNIVCFSNDKAEFEKQQLDRWKKNH